LIALPRETVRSMWSDSWRMGEYLLQDGMGRCPWRVAVCSMLLVRCRRVQMERPLEALLCAWPTPIALSLSDTAELEAVLRPCGFQRSRARRLQRFCGEWLMDWWSDMRELTGVGVYVADAVGLCCFDCVELESSDQALARRVHATRELA
jgi:endonuclease III